MLIKWTDYERIYRVINSILLNENADPTVCCVFFSAFGSYILKQHFGIDAFPRAGLAAFHLGNQDILAFGEEENGVPTGEKDAFHCWLEADGWVIDFMAPAFSQIGVVKNQNIPPKMFQKPSSQMSSSLNDLNMTGDFYVESTPETTAKHMQILSTRPAYADMAEIAVQWFKKSPKKMATICGIGDQNGRVKSVPLTGARLTGTW